MPDVEVAHCYAAFRVHGSRREGLTLEVPPEFWKDVVISPSGLTTLDANIEAALHTIRQVLYLCAAEDQLHS